MTSEGGKHRYVVLDSLRGVCACMVVLLHFTTQGHINAHPLVRNSFLFVDFFFVLSGFVIGSSYGRRLADGLSIQRFMWLRFGRIYPLHFAMLMVFVAFEIFFLLVMPSASHRQPFEGQMSVASLGYSLLLIQIFVGPDAVWNTPSWSIAAEMWTYLIFAVLLRYFYRWAIPICLSIAAVAPFIIHQLTDRNLNLFHDGALLRCIFGFSLGIMGWHLADWAERIDLGRRMNVLLELMVVGAVVLLVSTAGTSWLSLLAPFLFLVAVLVFSRERGVVSDLLRRAPFVLLGALSYSIYMVHWFLLFRLVNGLSLVERLTGLHLVARVGDHNIVGGGALFGDVMSIAFLGIVICASWCSYRFIELPGQRFVRRWPEEKSVSDSLRVAPGAP